MQIQIDLKFYFNLKTAFHKIKKKKILKVILIIIFTLKDKQKSINNNKLFTNYSQNWVNIKLIYSFRLKSKYQKGKSINK